MVSLRRSKTAALLVAFVLLLLPLTACDWDDVALIEEFAWQWAYAKEINPVAEDRQTPNPTGIVKEGARTVLGTGDEITDAILGADPILQKIDEADRLVTAGLANGDLSMIDQGIEKRPGDFYYRNVRAQAQLTAGTPNLGGALSDLAEADRLAAEQGTSARVRNLRYRLDSFVRTWQGLSPSVQQGLNEKLCEDVRTYASISGDSKYQKDFPRCR